MGIIRLIAVLLIVVGVISLIYQGVSYTKREKVIDLGPIEASVEEKKTIPLNPILGGIALIGGILLLVVPRRRSSSA